MTAEPERTALYRIFGDEDALLYIGISKDFGQRWKAEARAFPWWDEHCRMAVEFYPSRPEADAAETAAILAEKPKYNIAKTSARPAVREAAAASARLWIPVRIPASDNPPAHPFDASMRAAGGPTMAEVTLSDAAAAEKMIMSMPEEEREVARLRLESWRLNYKVCRMARQTLRHLSGLEFDFADRPDMVASIKRARTVAREILELPCPCCGGNPPAGLSCRECGAEGPMGSLLCSGPRRLAASSAA